MQIQIKVKRNHILLSILIILVAFGIYKLTHYFLIERQEVRIQRAFNSQVNDFIGYSFPDQARAYNEALQKIQPK